MARKRDSKPDAPRELTMPKPDRPDLKPLTGSDFEDFGTILINQAVRATWTKGADQASLDMHYLAAAAGMRGAKPRDELEGMLAAQLVACHNASMECFRRAMLDEQTFEGRRESLLQANKLSRTYTMLLDALNRNRGRGQQKIVVEHVHVHEGGQAIVGAVTAPALGEGHKRKTEEQPHAKLTDAREPALRSPDAERDAVPPPFSGATSIQQPS